MSRLLPRLHEGTTILDLGGGRSPAIAVGARPPHCRYVGFDASASELALAPPASYDEVVIGDAARFAPELQERFDLIVSWHVLEHLEPLGDVVRNVREYLRPGGRFVAHLAGAFSAHALINRVVPGWLGAYGMQHLLGRSPDTVFEARYDRCYHRALARELAIFSRFEILPHYTDASYFRFNRWLQAAYICYEEWAVARDHANLASHYLIAADR